MTPPVLGDAEGLAGATAARATPAVALRDLAQRLGGRWVLRGVTLRVAPGELAAVVGPNGSGKTTLLRVIATALRPTRGGGAVFGHDLRRDADAVRAVTSLLANGGGLYADLTAAENLMFAQRMAGGAADGAAVADALRRVGLAAAADTRVRAFSSGMQRRLALARLRLRRTPLLLLDEPYNSLDAAGATLVDELLGGVRERGGAALVVVHGLERARVAFDRVLELREGRLVCEQRLTARAVGATRAAVRTLAGVG